MKPTPNMIEPTDDEVAAALAAVQLYLAPEHTTSQPTITSRQQWTESAKLVVQGLRPTRTAIGLRWNAVERLRRNRGGDYGVVGL